MSQLQTYLDVILAIRKQSNDLYEKVGALRDTAVGSEKDPLNECRELLTGVWDQLTILGAKLTNERAKMPVDGNY